MPQQDFLDAAIAQQTNTAEAPKPTRLTRAKESADAIKQLTVQAALQFVGQTNAGFDLLWNNPYGLSPQEVATALGTDAATIFAKHHATAEFLIAAAPSLASVLKTPPSDHTIVLNNDGRVTITQNEPE